jgi:beta-glucosidase
MKKDKLWLASLLAAALATTSRVNGQATAAPKEKPAAEKNAAADNADAKKENDAIVPVPRDDKWMVRQNSINKRVAEGNVDLVFIGDSITQGWEGNGKEVWEKFYVKRHAAYLGIGGDRTQHVLWRLDHGNIEGIHPKVAVVMIGTNNHRNNSVPQIAEGIEAIVKKLREQLPETKILLLGIVPRDAQPSENRGKLLQVNQVSHKLADHEHVWFIDFGYKFVDSSGNISKSIMPDYLHLSKEGYTIWAEAIEPTLKKLLGD